MKGTIKNSISGKKATFTSENQFFFWKKNFLLSPEVISHETLDNRVLRHVS